MGESALLSKCPSYIKETYLKSTQNFQSFAMLNFNQVVYGVPHNPRVIRIQVVQRLTD